MTLHKKVLFYSLLTLLTLAAIEGISRLAYYFAFAEWYSLLPSPSAADPAGATPDEPAGLARQAPYTPLQRILRVSHPYYGFTSFFPNSPLNVMPPPQTSPDTILIAILGGSVAWEVTPYLQQSLTRYFADQGLTQNPVVIQLAYPAMKQPQQLHIASFMLAIGSHFDILINLDGYNELEGAYTNFDNAVFPFFPYQWEKLVFLTREEIVLAGQIRAARDQLSRLQQAAPASPFRYAALYGILHRYQLQQAETRILQLNYALANQNSARSLEQHGPYASFQDAAQVHQEAIRVWYRSSALLSRLAAAGGADYYHFLQPSQYIPDSKPLSDLERRAFLLPDIAATVNFPQTYPRFVQFGKELQQQGINYFDLTQIFTTHPETLYRDGCCHLNRRGYELLAAAIVQRLAPTLRRHAAMPNPQPDGTLTVAAPLLSGSEPDPKPERETPLSLSDLPFALAAEPDFQISLRPGNLLFYVKHNCRPEHTAAPFFLHIIPANAADLPPDRRRHGFQSRDFSFQDNGLSTYHWGGKSCVIQRILPDYPIASLRTGQFNPAGEIWSTELSFPE